MKTAWDIDHTLVYTHKRPEPATITLDDEPFLNLLVDGREQEINIVITGRIFTRWRDTYDLLTTLGLTKINQMCFNHIEKYDKPHIATMKTEHLNELGITHYVEDNPHYRKVMNRYWDGDCISSEEWSRI